MTLRICCIQLLFLASSITTVAQTAAAPADPGEPTSIISHIDAPGSNITISAPEQLLRRAMRQTEPEEIQENTTPDTDNETEEVEKQVKPRNKIAGYRVQVYADNNARSAKGEARQRERALIQQFPEYGAYVSYSSPYWRLRVGDFRSQYEAEKAAAEIKKAFPGYAREVRVVRDHVNQR